MIIKLIKRQYDYLIDNLSKEEIKQLNIFEHHSNNEWISIKFEDDVADEIRDWAIERQQQIGFDVNYNLTSEGRMLQELIDTFYVE